MRILIAGNLYPPVVFGGYEILCSQVAEGLRSRGHEVRILTSSFGAEGCAASEEVERSLALTTPFPKPGERVGYVDFRLQSLERVARINRTLTRRNLERSPADVVFCWCLNRLSLGPVFAAADAGCPACYTVNDEHPKQFRVASLGQGLKSAARILAERWVWPTATLRNLKPFPVTIISHALKKSLLSQGVPFAHAQVIHQGISLAQFPHRPLPRQPGEALRLVYVGQLSRAKGVHTILRALGTVRRQGWTGFVLDIVGSGVPDYEKELADIAEKEGVRPWINFVGRVAHNEIPSVYHKHHVLVFSSEWEEPFGLTHLEAMGCGCAVVSTTTGGSAELIRHGDNALAYQAGDAEALGACLAELSQNEELRRRLSTAGRRWVEQHHSFDRYLDRIEQFVEAAGRRKPA